MENQSLGESARQVPYIPHSTGDPAGTLVPVNMRTATNQALSALEKQVGSLDGYVADKLGYGTSEALHNYLTAEQIDAVALAIHNIEKGAGFIIGDQTGVGKGRVVASLIRYAKLTGQTPIFVTKKPDLYADMMRDLQDIDLPQFNPFLTNENLKVSLPDGGQLRTLGNSHRQEMRSLLELGNLGHYNGIFTTYYQLQAIAGEEPERREFLRRFADHAILLLDESHMAGGSVSDRTSSLVSNRADFTRELIDRARGVFYSSATYAKNPQVMTLYSKTNMRLAVGQMETLVSLVQKMGVPGQQALATMLTEEGQYIRRERSYAGVNFTAEVTAVDRDVAENVAAIMSRIMDFDRIKQEAVKDMNQTLKREAKAFKRDTAIGEAGAKSIEFAAIMHNLIDQMLLSLKAEATVQQSLALLQNGEKPVITVANTMGSFIGNYATAQGLKPGDVLDLDFGAMLTRYLERSREVIIKDAYGVRQFNHTRMDGTPCYRLSDNELGFAAVAAYEEALELIQETDFSHLPISPIDYIENRLAQAGYRVNEVTGREHQIEYTANGEQFYQTRTQADRSTNAAVENVRAFNRGDLDVMVLNQAGSTGISLHASEKFADQRPRHMIIAQAERNIDDFMQMLGRIHRFGQVVPPSYTLLCADIPAEKRPGAVLAKKMASLNANTTAARSSEISLHNVPDFINEYGDAVVSEIMLNHPELHMRLGSPLKFLDEGDEPEAAIRKVTGRIPLLPIVEQEALYDLIESEYKEFVQCQEAIGESILEAQSLDLDARTIARMEVLPADPNTASRFTSPVYLDVVDVKTLRKPFTTQEAVNFIRNQLNLPEVSDSFFFPRVRAEVDQAAEQLVKTRIEDLKLATEDYRSRYLFKLEPRPGEEAEEVRLRTGKAIAKFNEKLDRQLRHVEQTLESFPLGTPVRIVTANESIFYGVTARIWNTDPKGNPAAPGNWKMQFLLADPAKELTIPLSKVNTHTGSAIAVSVQERDFFGEPVYEVFDQRQQKNRQERQIFTGNTLRAMEKFNGKMINYTNQQGKTCQGVLTPQGFDIEKVLEHQPIPIIDPINVLKFLFEVTERTGQLKTPDQALVVRAQRKKDGNGLLLQVPKAKDAGGQYFLNQDLMAAAGGGEFFSVGKEMTLIVPPERIESVIQFLNTHGLSLAAFDQRHKARELMGMTLPEMQLVEQGQFEAQADYQPYVPPVDAQVIASLETSFRSEPEVLGTEPIAPMPQLPEPEAPIAPAGESLPLEATLPEEPKILETEPIAPIEATATEPPSEASFTDPNPDPAKAALEETTTSNPIAPASEAPQTPWMTVFPHLPQNLKDTLGLPQIRQILSHPDPIALVQTLQEHQPLFTDAYQHLANLYTTLHPTHTLQDTPMRDTVPVAATSPDTSPATPLDHTPLGDLLPQLLIEQPETVHLQISQKHLIEGLQHLPESWALTPVDAHKASYRSGWQTEPPLSRDELIAEINNGARGYGLRTGPVSGGIVAIDLDGPSAHAKLLELSGGQELPETIAFTSGRTGRSQHLFQVPKEIWPLLRTRKLATGVLGDDGKAEHVELRWQGLQSVLPPSVHPTTGQYQWLRSPQDTEIALVPGWVIERMLVEAKTLTPEVERKIIQPSPHLHHNHWSDRDWALSYLESLHPQRADDRDTWLKVGMALHSTDRSLLAEWDRWSTQSSKYKPGECEYIWNRFQEEKGITIATLGGWAKEDGWESPFESHTELNTKTARTIDPVQAYQQQVDQHDSQTGDWLAVPAQQPEHYSPSLREFKHWYFDARETGRQQKYLNRIQELAEDFKGKTPASATDPNLRNPNVTLSPPALAHMQLDATNYQTAIEQFARDARTILKHKGADKVVKGERVREYHSRVRDYTLHYRYPTKELTVHKAGKPLFHQSGNQVQLNQRTLHQEDFQLFGKEATRLREQGQSQAPIAATQRTSTEQSREGTGRVKQSVEMG